MDVLKKEKLERLLRYGLVLAIVFCCVLLLPQVRNLIIEIGEKILGRGLNHEHWMKRIFMYSLYAIYFFSFFLFFFIFNILPTYLKKHIQSALEKYEKKIFIIISIGIVIMSVIVRIIMFIKCRSLWGDEAALAASIVSRNWFELLVPPLNGNQSAPVLYVIVLKLFGSVLGYSEFSLKLFSLLTFFGLLICELILLKKAFNFDSFKTAFIVVMTAVLPLYIWYSNELKPYMSDVFFVVLTILLYFLYIKKVINLLALTVLCILVFGFSTPAIFFIGGMLFSEFLVAIFSKNKKQVLYVAISGTVILTVFGLYYYWWHLPVAEGMKTWWINWHNERGIVIELIELFSGFGWINTDAMYVWIFVPVAILGIYSLIICKNKIGYMVALSLFFAFFASSIGKYPLLIGYGYFYPQLFLSLFQTDLTLLIVK